MSRDLICIRDLPLVTTIGVHAWEREIRQELLLDLDLACDVAAAAASDALADALDYQEISDGLAELAAANQFQLLETLAEVLARHLLDTYQVPWLKLRLAKPGALPGRTVVSVEIERQRDD